MNTFVEYFRGACLLSCSVISDYLRPHELSPASFLCLWDLPGKNIGVGCHFLLQGIFLTQESNSGLLHWMVGSLPLYHLRSHFKEVELYANKTLSF